MASPDSEEEYLDDPIQLIDLEQRRITAAVQNYNSPEFEVTDCDGDLYIEKNKNVFKKSLQLFKKVAITLPVTFFEISRNVEQLNKCKPLSIKVVNCMEHPWYYKKYLNCIDISADIKVEFNSKSSNQPKLEENKDDMIAEGSKIKIRPVTSPYQNLKGDSSKNAICAPRESKLPESPSREKLKHFWDQEKNSQVDFKKNQGLIGMKITQTQETPKIVKKKTKLKLETTKDKTGKVKTSTDKTTSIKYKSENNTSTDLMATKVKYSKENVLKFTGDTKQDKTISTTKIINTSKMDSSKVSGSRVISHNTGFEILIDQEVLQNNSKPIADDNKCHSSKNESVTLEDNAELMTNCNANSKAIQKLNKPNSIEFTVCKVKRKVYAAPKISNVNNNSNAILKDPLHVLNNKTTNCIEKIDKVKDTSKKIGSSYIETAGNKSLSSVPKNMKLIKPKKKEVKKGDFCKAGYSKNENTFNIAKPKLIKEQKNNMNLKHTFSKNLHTKNSEDKRTSKKSSKLFKDFVKVPVLVKNDNIMDTAVQKTNSVNNNLSMNLNEAHEERKMMKNNINLLDNSVKTPVLVKNYTKLDNSTQNKYLACLRTSDMKNTEKQSITNGNTNEYSGIKESNKNQTSAFYIEQYAKIMKPSSQQNLSDVTIQIRTSLENERCNNNTTPNKNILANKSKEHKQKTVNQTTPNTAVSNQPANNDPIQAKTNNSRKKLTKQKILTSIYSNTELACSSAPNATPINKGNFTSIQTGASIETRVTTDFRSSRDTQKVPLTLDTQTGKNLTQDVSWKNLAPQRVALLPTPCTVQFPLNIPPEPKRCPRVIKISKKNLDTTDSYLHNMNSFDKISSHLQLAQNSLNKIQFSQPFRNSSTAAPQPHNRNQGHSYFSNLENIPQQNTPVVQQNQQVTNLNKISFGQSVNSFSTAALPVHNQNEGQSYLPNFENIPQQKLQAVQQNQPETISQTLANYHAAAQQIFVGPSVNQSLIINQNNMQSNVGDISRQLPTHPQNMPQMATTNTQIQEANQLLTGHNTVPDMVPPTCDIAVIQTLPHYDLNAKTKEFQPHQSPKMYRPRILLRKASKQPIRLNNNSVPLRHEVPPNVYPQNFGYGAQPNIQPYRQEFEQQYTEFSKIPPQNFIHCNPIYEGVPSNVDSVNPIPYDNYYWNNYYPMMVPPPPPPPLSHPPIEMHQQQLRPSTSQTCALFNQPNCITTTPKSVTGTTVIGCNYAGPIMKINILPEVTEASNMNLNNIQSQIIEPLKSANKETVQCENNCGNQTQISEKINNNGIKSHLSAEGQNVKQIQDSIVNSKREMLEELSKITTKESSRMSPVADFNTLNPLFKTKEVEVKRLFPETKATNEQTNELNKSLPECDDKLVKGNSIDKPLPQPEAKQQKTSLLKKPISESVEKQNHFIKTPVPKPDVYPEESTLLKRPLPTNKEDILIKMSKPGPLSKKLKLNATTSPKRTVPIPVAHNVSPVAHKGYSPPILPIPTYQKSLEILARSNIAESKLPLSNNYERIPELANTTARYSCEQKQEKFSKKISLEEYKKRCQGDVKTGELQVNNIKIEIKSENSEQDLGYDSDCTSKN